MRAGVIIVTGNRPEALARLDVFVGEWVVEARFPADRLAPSGAAGEGPQPEVTHSRNIAVRPEVGIVVFDSQVAIGAGQGVYMPAVATLLEGGEIARGIEAFSGRSVAHGGPGWASEDVRPGAGLGLYRATADSHWILAKDGRPDHRISVPLTLWTAAGSSMSTGLTSLREAIEDL